VYQGPGINFSASGSSIELNITDANSNTILFSSSGSTSITGSYNTGAGGSCFFRSFSGSNNTSISGFGLSSLNSGSSNTSLGLDALRSITTGIGNTGIGKFSNTNGPTTGSYNTFIITSQGLANTGSNSSNVYISNGGNNESNHLRISASGSGNAQVSKAFIGGIYGVTTSSITIHAMLVSNGDQLGTTASSSRYKDDIQDMDDSSSRILDLRPVTFTYKAHADKATQYGLIAEEVYETFPELVCLDDEGKPFSVRYHDMCQILLNEIQKTAKRIESLELQLGQHA